LQLASKQPATSLAGTGISPLESVITDPGAVDCHANETSDLRPRGETMRIGDGTTEHVVVVVVTDLDGSTRQQTHQWAMVTLARPVRFFFRSGCGRTRPRSPKQSFAPVLVRKEGSTGAFVCLSLSSHSYYLRIPTANTVLLE